MLRSTGRVGLCGWIFIVLLAGVGRARAQVRPSSDLLLPYFDVGLADGGTTTLLTVSSSLNRPVSVLATLSTNWGVPVLSIPLNLQAHQIWTVDLRDWLVAGKVPGVTLSAADLLHLQATLSGEPSPRDGLYYSTATAPDHAVGAITIRTLGDRPQALQGQFFLIDPSHSSSQAQNLDDIAAVAAPAELCTQHVVRQVAGGAPGASQVILWTDTADQALPSPNPQDRRLPVTVSAYSSAGSLLRRQVVPLLPVARISAADLGLTKPLGRLEIATGGSSVATVRADGSAVFTSACGQGPPPAPQPKVQIVTLINGRHAASPPGPSIAVGTPIVWSYGVSNTGSGNLTKVRVSDSVAGAVRCPQRLLKPGQSMTCTRSGVAEGCQQTNVGTVSATGTHNTPVSAQGAASYFGDDGSAVAITVSTNGQDADTPPGPSVQAGSAVSWTYQVVNTGTVRLYQISVQDDQGVAVSCPRVSLGPGEEMTCTASGVAVPGQYSNVGKVTATDTCGKVTASNPSHYFGESSSSLKLQTLINGFDADVPPGPSIPAGDPVTWQYVVTNTGKLTVSDISVTDDHDIAVSCPFTVLQPGESMTCMARDVAVSCQYSSLGTATGQTSEGSVSASDPSSYVGQGQATLDVRTYANGQSADQPPGPAVTTGTSVQWSYTVTNTGQVALTSVRVTDDRVTTVSCPQSNLQPGQSMTCTATSTAVSGYYVSRSVASGTTPCNSTVTASEATDYVGSGDPGLRIQTLVDDQNANTPPGPSVTVGGALAWSYVITNTGQIPLSRVMVSDSLGSFITCPQTSLQPGASMTCASQGTAQACQSSDLGTVTAQTPDGQALTAIDPAYYFGQAQAGVQVQVATNGVSASSAPGPTIQVGSPVTWTYTVVNTGNVLLNQIQVSDDQGAAVTCPAGTLAPGESMRCTAKGTAIEGQFHNTVTATGNPPCGAAVSGSAGGYYLGGGSGALQLQKLTAGQATPTAPGPTILLGSPVTWTYVVTNSGRVSLSGVGVTDNQQVAVICPKSTLQPGESMTCIGTGTAQACQYDNLGIATGQTASGQQINAVDQGFYFGQVNAAIALRMSVNGQAAPAAPGPTVPVGSTVAWSYLVTNSGNVALSSVRVTDGRGAAVTCPQTSLQPGQQMTCNATGSAVEGQYDDTASVAAISPCGDTATAQDAGHYLGQGTPGLQIQTLLNGQDVPQSPGPSLTVGTPILWSYTVTNLGQAGLSELVVTDDRGSIVTCQLTSLQPGESTACTATDEDVAQACTQVNLGKATAQSASGTITAFDPSFYVGQLQASLQMQMTVNGVRATAPPGPSIAVGDDVSWAYQVTNTGNVQLTGVKVQDSQGAAVDCTSDPTVSDPTLLDPGQSMTCTATGTAVGGQFQTTGTVTANSPCGSQVSAQDTSYYYGQTETKIQILKLLNGQHVDVPPGPTYTPGSAIAWRYIVTNPSTVTIQSIVVGDSKGVVVNCPGTSLAPGASMICTDDGKNVSQSCPYHNVGTAIGVTPSGVTVTDSDDSYYTGGTSHPGLAIMIDISTPAGDYPADVNPGPTLLVGGTVTWKYMVTNTGDIDLSNIVVNDVGNPSPICPKTTLAPQETMTCTRTGVLDTGKHSANNVTVKGTPPCGDPITVIDTIHYFGATLGVNITNIRADGSNALTSPGPSVTAQTEVRWDFGVTNTGNVDLSLVKLTDDKGFTISCPSSALLAGRSMTCTADGGLAGCSQNSVMATVAASSSVGTTSASMTGYYTGTEQGTLSIRTDLIIPSIFGGVNVVDGDTPPGLGFEIGTSLHFKHTVTNTVNVQLNNVTLSDAVHGCTNIPATLAPQQSFTCEYFSPALLGQQNNAGTISGRSICGKSYSATNNCYYQGTLP